MLVSAALSALFGCSYPSAMRAPAAPPHQVKTSETRMTSEGLVTKRIYYDGAVTYQRQNEPEDWNTHLAQVYDASRNPTASARSAAAVEREKLVPAAPAQTPAGGPAMPATGPKPDLPTQIYQPPSTPPSYQPPSGYHH